MLAKGFGMGFKKAASRGFTLIELIVVIAVIIILVGISVPAMSQFFKAQSLETSKRLLQSIGNTTRRLSITTRKPHRIVFYQVQEPKSKATTLAMRIFNVPDEEWVGNTYVFPNNVGFGGAGTNLADSQFWCYDVLPNDALPEAADMAAGGKTFLEFDANGKPKTTGITFQTVPIIADVELIDPASRVREIDAATPSDLKLVHRGSRNMCFIYISPSNGRVRGRIIRVTGNLPPTIN